MLLRDQIVLLGMGLPGFFRMASSAVSTSSLQSQPMYGDAAGWYSLLERVSKRSLSTQDALALAVRGGQLDGDSRWALAPGDGSLA